MFFWHQSEARTAATVWNWSGKTLSPGVVLAVLYFCSFHIYFSARLYFPRPHYLPLGLRGWLEGTARLIVFLTIMDKSPWDSHNVASILCVSQLLSQKAVVSFYKCMSPPPSPPNTMLKDQRNCAWTVSTLSVGWGEGVGTYSVSSARIQFRVC